jgi:hypothetical protein
VGTVFVCTQALQGGRLDPHYLLRSALNMANMGNTRLYEGQQPPNYPWNVGRQPHSNIVNIHSSTGKEKKVMGIAIKHVWILGDILFGTLGGWLVFKNGLSDIKSIIVILAFIIYTVINIAKTYWDYRSKKVDAKRKEYELTRLMENDHNYPHKKIK